MADTDNHRIRRIRGVESNSIVVDTLSGLAEDQTHPTYAPRSGFADGTRSEARFAYPSDVTCDENGVVFVADTYVLSLFVSLL